MYERKLILGFIRIHILHHACSPEGTYGLWMIQELKNHGYEISPGTIYPILAEMESAGLLSSQGERSGGSIRKVYRATPSGVSVLRSLRGKVEELYKELNE